ncbi:Anaerobic ribonucleoside-triphosphate reductase [compost metagenome]
MLVDFDPNKIVNAIVKAMRVTEYGIDIELAEKVANKISQQIDKSKRDVTVETIQDAIERDLMMSSRKDVAKEYIRYRQKRTEERLKQSELFKIGEGIISGENEEVTKENANLNGESFSGKMNRFGSEYSKMYTRNVILPKRLVKAIDDGYVYVHDLDHYAVGTHNCLFIPFDKLLANGFYVSDKGSVRTPNSIMTAMAQVAIIFQCQQNSQFGGCGAAKFDWDLAPYVTKSFKKHFRKGQKYFGERYAEVDDNELYLDNTDLLKAFPNAYTYARNETEIETKQAAESMIHNLNTMASRAGGQVPFTSITFGLCASTEGRMVSNAILDASMNGLGHSETAIFPQLIFQCKQGINQNEGEPNYDLFIKAIECSSKRLFPNFVNVDADFNLQYYDPEDPDTFIATMGCVDGDELITYKLDGELYVESFQRMYNKVALIGDEKLYGRSNYIEYDNLEIFDSYSKKFVKVKKVIKNPDQGNWTYVKLNNGRSLLATKDHPLPVKDKGRINVEDLMVGDSIPVDYEQYHEESENHDNEKAWLDGLILCDSSYSSGLIRISLGMDEMDIAEASQTALRKVYGIKNKVVFQQRGAKGVYVDIVTYETGAEKLNGFATLFGGWNKAERQIPNYIFNSSRENRLSFLAGMIDADGHVKNVHGSARVEIGSTNKELALQQMALAQTVNIKAKLYLNKYNGNDLSKLRYKVEFYNTYELNKYIKSKKKNSVLIDCKKEGNLSTSNYAQVMELVEMGSLGKNSYDVETESDHFDVSCINSHNCRTRVISNRFGKAYQSGRGNISFNSINLTKLGIEYGAVNGRGTPNIDGFWNKLDEVLDITLDGLLHRFDIQGNQPAKASDFMMQNGSWLDGEKLKPNQKVKDLLKMGSISIGFVGLAECLKALFGKHHGEDEDVWCFGKGVIQYIRNYCDRKSDEHDMNITCFATPAESLAGKFAKVLQKQYGEIEGVTDREYLTNSFHIPVYYDIAAHRKIDLEAPFHKLTNAGHISYVELDGNARNNQGAFKRIVQYALSKNMGYFSINHPVDKCMACNYDGVINDQCPLCGENSDENISRIRRVTGYLVGNLNRFNSGKKAEERDRVKHK